MIFARAIVELSQPTSLNTCDGFLTGIEAGLGAAKDLGGNLVLDELTTLTSEILLPDVVQELGRSGRSAKLFRDRLELVASRFHGNSLGVLMHNSAP
jgi:hypothetical protein